MPQLSDDDFIRHIRSDTRRQDADALRDIGANDTCTCGVPHREVRDHNPGCRKTVWEEAARTLELLAED